MAHASAMTFAIFTLAFLSLPSCAPSKLEENSQLDLDATENSSDLKQTPGLMQRLGATGPYQTREIRDFVISLSPKDKITCDLFEPKTNSVTGLLIISHGNFSTKAAHEDQARKIATWGLRVLTLSLPNHGEWIENGERIYQLTKLLEASPKIISNKFDPKKIVLAGHSFGGSAVSIAAGKGAPVLGLILLDPALYSQSVSAYLRQIFKPVLILGADRKIFTSRRRATFYKEPAGETYELSIKNAHHDDAQLPSMRQTKNIFFFDALTSGTRQSVFVSAMTLAALDLMRTRTFASAWSVFMGRSQSQFFADFRSRASKPRLKLGLRDLNP